MSTHIEQTIEAMEQKLREHLREADETRRMINQLLKYLGREPRHKLEGEAGAAVGVALRGDEYVGKVQQQAVRLILERRRAAGVAPSTLDEIYGDLREGGYQFEAKDAEIAKKGIHNMMTKASSTFFRLQNGKWGLRAWYPGAKASVARKATGNTGVPDVGDDQAHADSDPADAGDRANAVAPELPSGTDSGSDGRVDDPEEDTP